ncbi:hypothetical protein LL912_05615 [Niabella sp. CC-SYL272]|uniref:hypothetical protein n=1 Tax=Niabella agricola TaxID=2891571 RepID=UPI001F3D4AAA|nr:hypothetical protein [Niabella agricola]MCF3108249.1 hypothetical protein [Niabella agricola]
MQRFSFDSADFFQAVKFGSAGLGTASFSCGAAAQIVMPEPLRSIPAGETALLKEEAADTFIASSSDSLPLSYICQNPAGGYRLKKGEVSILSV